MMLAAHLCFRALKAEDVIKCFLVRAFAHYRGRKQLSMNNGGMMISRGNRINSEGNLFRCETHVVTEFACCAVDQINVLLKPVELVSV